MDTTKHIVTIPVTDYNALVKRPEFPSIEHFYRAEVGLFSDPYNSPIKVPVVRIKDEPEKWQDGMEIQVHHPTNAGEIKKFRLLESDI